MAISISQIDFRNDPLPNNFSSGRGREVLISYSKLVKNSRSAWVINVLDPLIFRDFMQTINLIEAKIFAHILSSSSLSIELRSPRRPVMSCRRCCCGCCQQWISSPFCVFVSDSTQIPKYLNHSGNLSWYPDPHPLLPASPESGNIAIPKLCAENSFFGFTKVEHFEVPIVTHGLDAFL